jgi:hypothetical protein
MKTFHFAKQTRGGLTGGLTIDEFIFTTQILKLQGLHINISSMRMVPFVQIRDEVGRQIPSAYFTVNTQ